MQDEAVPVVSHVDLEGMGFGVVEVWRRRDGKSIRGTSGRRTRAVGRYFSIKTGQGHWWESRPELLDLYHAEANPLVVSYVTQPETLTWWSGGRRCRYTPDRVDVLSDGSKVMTEVKDVYPDRRDPGYAEKLEEAVELYRLLGRTLLIRDRAIITAEPLFSAVEEIQAYRCTIVTTHQACRAAEILDAGAVTLGDLVDLLPDPHPRFSILAMVARRIVRIDLSRGLSKDSPVYLVGDDRHARPHQL